MLRAVYQCFWWGRKERFLEGDGAGEKKGTNNSQESRG